MKLRDVIFESRIMLAEDKLRMKIPSDIKKIHKAFKKSGKQLYVVGGAVRDAILGKSPKDFDLTTDAKPDEVMDIAKKNKLKAIDVGGKSFGVVLVNGHEIATFRKDIGRGRRPSSVDFTDIKGDVERRDLTINALFYDIDKQTIVDLVGGIEDLRKGQIRTVGKAEERFDEDPLRKLRALRFAGTIGGKMHTDTYNALKENPDLSGVSSERIRDEFIKGIKKAKSTKQYLNYCKDTKILPFILPGLNLNLKFIDNNDAVIQVATLLIKNNYNTVENKLKGMSYTNQEVKNISFLLKLNKFNPTDIYIMKKEQDNTSLTKSQIDDWSEITGNSDVKKVWNFKLSVTSKEIIDMGFKGKEIGDKMKELETNKYLGE
tara:strand:+ start:1382 stop:2506 length:1125 start_codon:yes stop_codon:yes gene_type:complete